MRFIPWSAVRSWHCVNCGLCCKYYDVALKFPEWLSIVKNFGVEYTAPDISNFFLKRRPDGSCIFLAKNPTTCFCSLQYTKPQACRLWPFKILDKSRYGKSNEAVYRYSDQKLFVYIDSACNGLRYGVPTQEFIYTVVPEFIEIAMGVRFTQFKSTAFL